MKSMLYISNFEHNLKNNQEWIIFKGMEKIITSLSEIKKVEL